MNSLKIAMIVLILSIGMKAQAAFQSEAEKIYEEEMSLEMCGSLAHRFDSSLNECIYCAHGLTYNPKSLKCTGTSDVLGKCFGKDHYHAKTQECMYCAKGYKFNEDLRECLESQATK